MTMTLQASPPPDNAPLPSLDSGLAGLALIAGYYRIAAEPMQLRHQLALSGRLAGAEDLVRGGNLLGLRSRILRNAKPERFAALPLPALIGLKDGGYGVLAAGSSKERLRLIDPVVHTARDHGGAPRVAVAGLIPRPFLN